MAGRLAHHLLLSLGVATATALLAALPAFLSGATPGQRSASAAADRPAVSALVLLQGGKIIERLDGAAVPASIAVDSPVTPATLAMPLSLGWPEAGDWSPTRLAVLGDHRSRTNEGAVRPAARRATPQPARNPMTMAGPLVILPPAPATAIEAAATAAPARDDSWSRLVLTPVVEVADAVSGAAGSVQAAGSWGLSQAGNLLPRW